MKDLSDLTVAIVAGSKRYPRKAPFHPPEAYPELPYSCAALDPENSVYPMVRESLRVLGLDSARFATKAWNPLGEIISPGQRVLIKPNFVLHYNAGQGPLDAVVTHPSVLRPIVDYVLLALRGHGEITIGDAPQMNCDWSALFRATGMDGLAEFLQEVCHRAGIKFSTTDFRLEQTFYWAGLVWKRKSLRPADEHTIKVNLASKSFMDNIDVSRLYGADYDRRQTVRAHQAHRHEYWIARDVLAADVVISVPKLKVHSKVGTTLNLKNMVGINTDKNHLAHYRVGPPSKGGDEFSDPCWDDTVERTLSDVLLGRAWWIGKYPMALWHALRKCWRGMVPRKRRSFTYGNWWGNDTAWRMALDLNRVLLTADPQGGLHHRPQRKYLSFIDGIVGGQGNGPLYPDAYDSGVIVAGSNPVAVDWVATRLMGLEPTRIPMYVNAAKQMQEWVPSFDVSLIEVRSNLPEWSDILTRPESIFTFATAPGWRGRAELYSQYTQGDVTAADPILQ
jgi:uncharacterized protein (DUF362 family)